MFEVDECIQYGSIIRVWFDLFSLSQDYGLLVFLMLIVFVYYMRASITLKVNIHVLVELFPFCLFRHFVSYTKRLHTRLSHTYSHTCTVSHSFIHSFPYIHITVFIFN